MKQWLTSLAVVSGMCGVLSAQVAAVRSEPYVWKSVQMVGGGFVDGIVCHPTTPGVRYARTDMGGAYRWDDQNKRWEPILDWVSYEDSNLMGVESIALDPADPNRVYLACGTYTHIEAPNAILRSSDRGRTWARTDVRFKMGGNEDGRGNGERMAVDPHDGKVLFMGTRHHGLWTSEDRGVSWTRVTGFPDVTERRTPSAPTEGLRPDRAGGSGIVFLIFDPGSGSQGQRCSRIYAGVSLMNQDNLLVSQDAGKTWQPVPGHPQQYRPTHASLSSDGSLYITYGSSPGPSRMQNGGVWKLDNRSGEWTDITPDKPGHDRSFGYAAVGADSQHPRTLIVSTFGRPGGEEVFRTTDGGQSWKGVFAGGGAYDYSKAPYVKHTGIHWLFDIEIDPANPDHAIFTCGYGGHETFNLTDLDRGKPTLWHCMATGIEETVALDLLSPPAGAHLISAVVTAEMLAVRILAAAVKTAHDMVHFRDPETGGHIDRMSRYARLIAQHLGASGVASLDDATIERIFEFAPLHDIGKLALPDRILLKPARLTVAEREEMKQHTVRGLEMIESIAHNFGLEHLDGLDLLRHIAESHHETMDGGGYPHGLHEREIPLEARIVAVADVFDALTSARPYKPSWTDDEAFAWLRKLSRSKFDEDCVDALLFNVKKVKEIQAQFQDTEADPQPERTLRPDAKGEAT